MSKKARVTVPRDLRARVRHVATRHRLGSPEDAVAFFVTRGLDRYGVPPGELAARIAHAVESRGYSSAEELIEHLILRGLHAYEEPTTSPEQLAERLRGLGYIE